MSSGIYHDYGIFVWAFDAPVSSSAIWAEIAGLIGSKAEEFQQPSPPTPPEASEVINSTSGRVEAFAYDWWWSKDRAQDGRYGETYVTIDLPEQPVVEAALYVSGSYSQQSGSATVSVYISTKREVTPSDADHDRGSWWVGNTVELGQKLGDFETYYGSTEEWSFDITSFVNQNLGQDTFYIAFENHAHADVGIGSVYVEVIPSPTPEPEPEPEPETPPTSPPVLDEVISKIDLAKQRTLITVFTEEDSFLNAAVESKIQLGFLVGRLLEKHYVDLELLETILSADLYEGLDYAYDLDKIDSLRSYCQANDYDGFSAEYEQYARQKVRAEFSFDEAEQRINEGFAELEARAEDGEFGYDANELEALLDTYTLAIIEEMWDHAAAMYQSQQAAKSIDETIGIIDTLTSLCDTLFGTGLDNAKLVSELSLVWAQNEVRYWTTTAYLWGGTEKLQDNWLEQLRQQYDLFERQEFYYGTVFAAEEGLDKVLRGEEIE